MESLDQVLDKLNFLQNNLIMLKLQGESGDETEAQVPIRRKKVKVSCIKNKNYAVAKAATL